MKRDDDDNNVRSLKPRHKTESIEKLPFKDFKKSFQKEILAFINEFEWSRIWSKFIYFSIIFQLIFEIKTLRVKSLFKLKNISL